MLFRSNTPRDYVATGGGVATVYYGPRFDYDANTLTFQGLLTENVATNYFSSSDMNTSPWILTNVTLTSNAHMSPAGTYDAAMLTPTAGVADGNVSINLTSMTCNTLYVFSIFAKANGMTSLNVTTNAANSPFQYYTQFNLNTGAITMQSINGLANAHMIPYSNGWWRCVMSTGLVRLGPATGNIEMMIKGVGTGSGSNGVMVWAPQLEEGLQPTSVIITKGVTSSRANDMLYISNNANKLIRITGKDFICNANVAIVPNVSASSPQQVDLPTEACWIKSFRIYNYRVANNMITSLPSWLTYTVPSTTSSNARYQYDSTGLLTYAPHNFIINSVAPANQTITTSITANSNYIL